MISSESSGSRIQEIDGNWPNDVSNSTGIRLVKLAHEAAPLSDAYSVGFLGNGTLSYCIRGLAEGRGSVLEARQIGGCTQGANKLRMVEVEAD